MTNITIEWDGQSNEAKLANHSYEEQVEDIYLDKSIIDYFNSRDFLEKIDDNSYQIKNHDFMLDLSGNSEQKSLWEISQEPPTAKLTSNCIASVVDRICGTPLVEKTEDKAIKVTCRLNN